MKPKVKLLELQDPEVAKQYRSEFSHDPHVHVAGGSDVGKGWSGKLSTIPLWAAERLVEMESNLLEKISPEDQQRVRSENLALQEPND